MVALKWKRIWSGSKNSQQNLIGSRYMHSFEGGTVSSRETVTVFRSRDVILRGSASFRCMIHVPVSVIIPALKRNPWHFDSLSYMYMHMTVHIWVGQGTCSHMCVNTYIIVSWSTYVYMYVCVYLCKCICVYIHIGALKYFRGCGECVCCRLYFVHSFTSPSLSGDGLIKLSCDLKYFNFIVTFFRFSLRRTIWQYFFSYRLVTQCLDVGNFHFCVYTSVVKKTKLERACLQSVG